MAQFGRCEVSDTTSGLALCSGYHFDVPAWLAASEWPNRKACPCCHLKLPDEMFPANVRGYERFGACIACKRECRGRKSCRLGTLHDIPRGGENMAKKKIVPLNTAEAREVLRAAGVTVAAKGRLSEEAKAQVKKITGRPVL